MDCQLVGDQSVLNNKVASDQGLAVSPQNKVGTSTWVYVAPEETNLFVRRPDDPVGAAETVPGTAGSHTERSKDVLDKWNIDQIIA